MKIYANGAAYDLHYAMKKRKQGWMVTNVTLDGINLGLAFRQQFASEMAQNKGSIDDVIAFGMIRLKAIQLRATVAIEVSILLY